MPGNNSRVMHKGGCHCGAVRFELVAPAHIDVFSCNCSICAMTGFLHLFATKEDFHLVKGGNMLTEYRFNTGTARHLFCKNCGVKAFYVPRSHPDGWSINANCLDEGSELSMSRKDFDGANWEDNIRKIT